VVYFCTAIIAVVAYLFVYTRVTPHDEFKLIRDNDPAAAIALGLSLLGFVLPLVSAITVRPPRQVGKWCVRSK
jgi:putative membrane protein